MKLNILSIGSCRAEDFLDDNPESQSTIENIPAKDIMPRNLRRLSSRLAKMFYVATNKAMEDAGLEHCNIPIIAGTGICEIDAGYELVKQIEESKGRSISPTLVQNSVHNAPAGFLSIGLKNTAPVMTLAHSFLSWEAVIDYAFTFLYTSSYKSILVVSGDQYRSEWVDYLENSNELALVQNLKRQNFREGALALLLSSEDNPNSYGTITNAIVSHLPNPKSFSKSWLEDKNFKINSDTVVVIREFTQSFLPDPQGLSVLLGMTRDQILYFPLEKGFSLASPFAQILDSVKEKKFKHILFLSAEFNDIAIVEVFF